MKPKLSSANRRLYNALVRAHPSITDIEQRRQAQLLASLLIVVGTAFALSAIWVQWFSPRRNLAEFAPQVLSITAGLIIIDYLLTRRGHYQFGAFSFVLATFVVFHLLGLLLSSGLDLLFYAIMPIFLSIVLLPFAITWALLLTSIVFQVLLIVPTGRTTLLFSFTPLVFLLVTVPIILVIRWHLLTVERERRTELEEANAALRASEASLTLRIAERTRDLEVAADISRQVTTLIDLPELLFASVERTRQGFNLDQAAVFLVDSSSQALVLEASAGKNKLPSELSARRFSVQAERGLVSQAARTQTAVLANDVSQTPQYIPDPALLNTRSELALPMAVGGALIGVLDLQSDQVARFSQDDVRVLTTLAEQIAIAVDNARLFREIEIARQRAEDIGEVNRQMSIAADADRQRIQKLLSEQVEITDKLRTLDTMKSQFVATMSHELRTPLNAILNFSEFIVQGMMGPLNDEQRDALGLVLDSSRHLLSLINDILDMTKIEAGMLTLFIEENINVYDELVPVLAAARVLLKDKPVQLIEDIDSDIPNLAADRRRLRQILLNLLANACKFTERGSVTLSIKYQGDQLLMAVFDTGPGIAQKDQALIFVPFRQTLLGAQIIDGIGLGLPITKRLVEAHGGQLWIESEPGQGAAFFAQLPVRAPLSSIGQA